MCKEKFIQPPTTNELMEAGVRVIDPGSSLMVSDAIKNRLQTGGYGYRRGAILDSIVVHNLSVYAPMGDPRNPGFIEFIEKLKGSEREGRPLGLVMSLEDCREKGLVEKNLLSPASLDFVKKAVYFNRAQGSDEDSKSYTINALGAFPFIRIPVKGKKIRESNVPLPVVADKSGKVPEKVGDDEIYYIQIWDPSGDPHMTGIYEKFKEKGIDYPAITSLNRSGKPEITQHQEAVRFLSEIDEIADRCVLVDKKDGGKASPSVGSYPIIELTKKGRPKLIREGNVPNIILEKLLGARLDKRRARPSKFNKEKDKRFEPLVKFLNENDCDPMETRMLLLMYMKLYDLFESRDVNSDTNYSIENILKNTLEKTRKVS